MLNGLEEEITTEFKTVLTSIKPIRSQFKKLTAIRPQLGVFLDETFRENGDLIPNSN